MSEYQYHEFCRISSPMPKDVRKIMNSFSSRATLTTHGASYVYNYSDFNYEPIEILKDYFDVYFYIANWGTLRLAFKFDKLEIDYSELKKFQIEDENIKLIEFEDCCIIDIELAKEEGFGWTDGEDMLTEILPLYTDIKNKNYQFLSFANAINKAFLHGEHELLNIYLTNHTLSPYNQLILNLFNR